MPAGTRRAGTEAPAKGSDPVGGVPYACETRVLAPPTCRRRVRNSPGSPGGQAASGAFSAPSPAGCRANWVRYSSA
ncbi:hypothetical protein GCM10009535_23990 [Streptomyces thermocarboxydovorans]|uniref:Uncharacterized protein n=1 Tax=Streptomyces thermocarboxydovorans TaxID=59298 RepID=A0ABP3SRD3_9ACTN